MLCDPKTLTFLSLKIFILFIYLYCIFFRISCNSKNIKCELWALWKATKQNNYMYWSTMRNMNSITVNVECVKKRFMRHKKNCFKINYLGNSSRSYVWNTSVNFRMHKLCQTLSAFDANQSKWKCIFRGQVFSAYTSFLNKHKHKDSIKTVIYQLISNRNLI